MIPSTYKAIIKQAAREYFRDDDAPLGYLTSAQHRAFVNAVHGAYAKIGSERSRRFIEAVYKDDSPRFADAVETAANQCKLGKHNAWKIMEEFIADVAESVKLK